MSNLVDYMTIRQARRAMQAANQAYFEALDRWEDEPNASNGAKVQKAALAAQDAYEQFRRVKRRAEWERARRLLCVANRRIDMPELRRFVENHFRIERD